MEIKVKNKTYKRAIARLEKFMSENAVHWKQDIGFIKHLLEEKQELEQIIEEQRAEISELSLEHQFYKRSGIEKSEEIRELAEFTKFIAANSQIFVDKIGFNLEFKWFSFNAYIPNDKKDLIEKVLKKYGENTTKS